MFEMMFSRIFRALDIKNNKRYIIKNNQLAIVTVSVSHLCALETLNSSLCSYLEHGHDRVLRLAPPFESPSRLTGWTVTDSRPAASGVAEISVTTPDKGRLGAQDRVELSHRLPLEVKFKVQSRYSKRYRTLKRKRLVTKGPRSRGAHAEPARHNMITKEAGFLVTPTASSRVSGICVLIGRSLL